MQGTPKLGLRLFEPSLLVGVYISRRKFGLSVGGSFLNIRKGEYRLGANFILTEESPYLGATATWHPRIAGKHLKHSIMTRWVIDKEGNNTWSLGVHFQVW